MRRFRAWSRVSVRLEDCCIVWEPSEPKVIDNVVGQFSGLGCEPLVHRIVNLILISEEIIKARAGLDVVKIGE